jgi:hypothetical protein
MLAQITLAHFCLYLFFAACFICLILGLTIHTLTRDRPENPDSHWHVLGVVALMFGFGVVFFLMGFL